MRTQAILKLYEQVEQEKDNSKAYDTLLKRFNILREKFDNEISKQQQKQLEQILSLMNRMCSIETKEYFVDGYSISTKLFKEALLKENIKQ